MDATFTVNNLYLCKEEKFVSEDNRGKINEMWYINMRNKHPEITHP